MNQRLILDFSALALGGCAIFGGSSPFTVAKDGTSACVVVSGEFAKPVAELTNYLHRITGAKFEVVKTVEAAKERPAIVFEKGEAVTDRDKFVVMQSYALKSSAKRLTLRSSHERGMLYGVYGLLRDHCGVRFYSPKFEVVPKNPSLTLDVDDVQKPAFRWRGYGWWDFKREWLPFFFKNRAGGLPTETLTSQHSLYTWAKSPAKDPAGPAKGRSRVVKGGSYCFSEDHARIDSRSLLEPNQYDCMPTGFRYVIPE